MPTGDPPNYIYPFPPNYYRSPPIYGWPQWNYGDNITMGQPPCYGPSVGLTEAEKTVCKHLADAWNDFVALDGQEVNTLADFRQAIDACHKEIALRVARRANPEIWQSSTAQSVSSS